MSPEEKLDYVRKQIHACEEARTNVITCPYCGQINQVGEPLCCETFAKAAMAIISADGVKERIELAERIGEAASRN